MWIWISDQDNLYLDISIIDLEVYTLSPLTPSALFIQTFDYHFTGEITNVLCYTHQEKLAYDAISRGKIWENSKFNKVNWMAIKYFLRNCLNHKNVVIQNLS